MHTITLVSLCLSISLSLIATTSLRCSILRVLKVRSLDQSISITLLEIQILLLLPGLLNQILGRRPAIWILTSPPGDSEV